MAAMTMRERMIAVIKGLEHDRVPFAQYSSAVAPNEEVWSLLGRENMGVIRWTSVHRKESPNCSMENHEVEKDGLRGYHSVLHTPVGELTQEVLLDPVFGTGSIRKHFVSEPKDYEAFIAYLSDTRVVKDTTGFLQAQDCLGDDGILLVSVDRTPYQQLWVQWVCIEDLSMHFVDCPDIVEECVSLLTGIQRKIHRIIREAADEVPIQLVDVPDNITAPVIGPRNFEKYCVPFYNELADILTDKDIPVFVHMDGDLKPLWKAIGESKVGGIDSLSPPPDNDTSVADVIAMWPEMRVFVNFPSSVHLAEPEVVYEHAMRILNEGGRQGRLQIQISENVPPSVWRKSLPAIAKAIEDFGPAVG